MELFQRYISIGIVAKKAAVNESLNNGIDEMEKQFSKKEIDSFFGDEGKNYLFRNGISTIKNHDFICFFRNYEGYTSIIFMRLIDDYEQVGKKICEFLDIISRKEWVREAIKRKELICAKTRTIYSEDLLQSDKDKLDLELVRESINCPQLGKDRISVFGTSELIKNSRLKKNGFDNEWKKIDRLMVLAGEKIVREVWSEFTIKERESIEEEVDALRKNLSELNGEKFIDKYEHIMVKIVKHKKVFGESETIPLDRKLSDIRSFFESKHNIRTQETMNRVSKSQVILSILLFFLIAIQCFFMYQQNELSKKVWIESSPDIECSIDLLTESFSLNQDSISFMVRISNPNHSQEAFKIEIEQFKILDVRDPFQEADTLNVFEQTVTGLQSEVFIYHIKITEKCFSQPMEENYLKTLFVLIIRIKDVDKNLILFEEYYKYLLKNVGTDSNPNYEYVLESTKS